MATTRCFGRLAGAGAACALACSAHAQIRTDGSVGPAAQSLAGPNYSIPEALGALRGGNLFHSFSVFGIGTGESATFTTSSPGIANVISRVTGGEASLINGALRLSAAAGTPGFYFINPAGVLFGAGASIDVPGGFHVSTADYVKFADGRYYADASSNSTLSAVAPDAFGFLGARQAAIGLTDGARLGTALMQPFSIVASRVVLDNGRAVTQGADIRIVALGGAGEVPFAGPLPAAHGELRIVNGGQVSAPAVGTIDGGHVRVSAGDIFIERGAADRVTGILSQSNTGAQASAGGIDIQSTGTLRVVDGGVISSSAFSTGNAGSVVIRGRDIELDGRASPIITGIFSSANSGSSGDAGSVDIQASGRVSVLSGANISSSAFSGARDGGTVSVAAADLVIDRLDSALATGLFATAGTGSTGRAGDIDIALSGSLAIREGLVSSTTFSIGDSGSIRVRARDIVIDRHGVDLVTGIFSQAELASTGNAGTIDVAASGPIALLNGARISSSSLSSGRAGEVRVSGGDITIDGGTSTFSTGIASNANAGGRAGEVFVATPGTLTIANRSVIASNSFSTGAAGSVDVRAGNLLIDGGPYTDIASGIASNAYDEGHAGSVHVTVSGLLSVSSGGEISSSTFDRGDAGEVTITADRLVIDGRGFTAFGTGIYSASEGRGNAGRIDVFARDLRVMDGAEITSSTRGAGAAGQVRVRAEDVLLDGGAYGYSAIQSSAQSGSTGAAGSVEISATGTVLLRDGGEIASSTFSSGNAGTVNVAARNIVLDGRGNPDATTAIISQANEGTGNAGNTTVSASESLVILANATISSSTFDRGNAGTVEVTAGRITIDATGSDGNSATGILSGTFDEATGNAGSVRVTTPGLLQIIDGAEISSNTFGSGNAGSIIVHAGSMDVDGRGYFAGVFSQAMRGSTGSAGAIAVEVAGLLSLTDYGKIASTTFGPGNAGTIRVVAADLLIDGNSRPTGYTGIGSNTDGPGTGNAGNVTVDVSGTIMLRAGGEIASSTFTPGDAASVTVRAGAMTIDGVGECLPCTGIFSQAENGSSGRAGLIDVTVIGALVVRDSGLITTGTNNAHDAGRIRVQAGEIVIDGGGFDNSTGIMSNAIRGSGSAGIVDVTAARTLDIVRGGSISSTTFSAGDAGRVHVEADRIAIDAGDAFSTTTGIVSLAADGTGDAGTVDVVAREIRIKHGGVISSSTSTSGNAGNISVNADLIDVDWDNAFISTGILSSSTGDGNAGRIDIDANDVRLRNGGLVSSTAYGEGNGGAISIRARSVVLDGGPDEAPSGILSETSGFGAGTAGSIDIVATDSVTVMRGGAISSSSQSYGAAGTVSVTAPIIKVIGGTFNEFSSTGIETRAGFYASAAGTVNVNATDRLEVLNGGVITASTSSFSGEAGSVFVNAPVVVVDGAHSSINARAEDFSRGQTGNVTVAATRSITVSNGGEIAISNLMSLGGPYPWTLTPTLLSVSAPVIELRDGGTISAASLGDIAASNIAVQVGERMLLDNASITTSAVGGNGGAITLAGDGVVNLRNSRITTSVTGAAGNGGDITIATRGLVLDTGFVQANTAAQHAAGGNVSIDVAFLIPSGNSLFVAGEQPIAFRPGVFGLNVIQAAAPTGVSGAISITTPSLDVSAGLATLTARVLDDTGIGRSLCETSGGSALAQAGRGAMPASSRGFLRAEDPDFAGVADAGRWVPLVTRIACTR